MADVDDEDANLAAEMIAAARALTKLQLDANVAVHADERLPVRDEDLAISTENTDKYGNFLATNYVFVKNILRYFNWQDKLIYRHVCSTWKSAVDGLHKERMHPVDFSLRFERSNPDVYEVKQSSAFTNEPVAVFSFINVASSSFTHIQKCTSIIPPCCEPPCEATHLGIDVIHKLTTAPKECMLAVKTWSIIYLPLTKSKTFENAVLPSQNFHVITGISIPVIPNVEFQKINLKNYEQVSQEFATAIDDIVKDRVIKGLLVFVSGKMFDDKFIKKILFLDYVKIAQPDIPYAMGGCMCTDTILDSDDINYYVNNISEDVNTGNLVTIGLFTVPKDQVNNTNFDMFSCVMESYKWESGQIHEDIAKFSRSVPRYEHSVCIKLACLGRDNKQRLEQEAFRSFFPNTPIVGCCGYGEAGINHPPLSLNEPPMKVPKIFQYGPRKVLPEPYLGFLYSYATVFVYICWGKITSPAEDVQ